MKTVPRRTLTLPLAALAALAIAAPGAWAANAGDVDTGFNASLTAGSGTIVNDLALYPDGRIVATGNFSRAGFAAVGNIARLGTDGTLDATFQHSLKDAATPPAPAQGNSIAVQADGKVVVGGFFRTISGTARNRVARINSDGSLDATFDPDSNSWIATVELQPDGKILAGGNTGGFGSPTVGRYKVGLLDTDGTLNPFIPYVNADVRTTAMQPDGKVLVGGDFWLAGDPYTSQTRRRIARFNADGVPDFSFDAGVDPGVNDTSTTIHAILVQSDGKILIGGSFTTAAGQARNYIARLNADGTLDTGFAPNISTLVNGRVESMALQGDGKVLIGGAFSTIDGQARNGFARLNANGSLDTTFLADVDSNTVASIAIQPDGKILAGGGFTSIGRVPTSRTGLARLYGAPPAGAPTGAGAAAGNGQATVSWTAVPGDIASYTVTSSPGGQTCTTSSTSCSITGLTNGTTYTFSVRASNEFGAGPASGATGSVIPTAPVGSTSPSSGASPGSSAGGSTSGSATPSGQASSAARSAAPLAGAWVFNAKTRVGTTTGTVPPGATAMVQTIGGGGGQPGNVPTKGFLEMATAMSTAGRCNITTVRNKKTKKVTKRTYRCTIRLSKGTWTVTTTARGAAGVVAESSRRVVVK